MFCSVCHMEKENLFEMPDKVGFLICSDCWEKMPSEIEKNEISEDKTDEEDVPSDKYKTGRWVFGFFELIGWFIVVIGGTGGFFIPIVLSSQAVGQATVNSILWGFIIGGSIAVLGLFIVAFHQLSLAHLQMADNSFKIKKSLEEILTELKK